MTTCCSSQCEKKYDCARHCYNSVSTCPSENYYSATEEYCSMIDGTVFRHRYLCGELGNYKMFKPIEEEPEEKILFPWQYMEKFFLGEIQTFDEAITLTADEVERLLRKYAEKHNLKQSFKRRKL